MSSICAVGVRLYLDEVMSIVIRGNPIEVGDDNPMFGGLVIAKGKSTAVQPAGKLAVTWGEIK